MGGRSAADPEINPDAVVRLPVQYWTFTMSNSKEAHIATRARSHMRGRGRRLDSSSLGSSCLGSGRRFCSNLQVMFPSRRLAEGRDPPPVYRMVSSPCSGLPEHATDAHGQPSLPRRNDGAAAVRVALVRSERIAILI